MAPPPRRVAARRSTEPRGLLEADDPIGPENDEALRWVGQHAGVVIAAWGAFPLARRRSAEVVEAGLLGDYRVLGLTAQGHPRHPLYMRADSRPLRPPLTEGMLP